jgi:hypothetical protein
MKQKGDTVKEEVLALVEFWKKNRIENLEQEVFELLNSKCQQFLISIMGLREAGRKWEPDPFNANEGTVIAFLKKELEPLAEKWAKDTVKKFIERGELDIPLQSIVQIRKSAEGAYRWKLESLLKEEYERRARIDAEKIIKEFFDSEITDE